MGIKAGTLHSGAGRLRREDGTAVNRHLGVSGFAEFATVRRRSLMKIDPELPLVEASRAQTAASVGHYPSMGPDIFAG